MVNDVFMAIARRPKAIDITGERFGRLVAVRRAGKDKRNNALWLCKCDCGNEVIRATSELNKRNNHSCGCLAAEHWLLFFGIFVYVMGYITGYMSGFKDGGRK